MSFRLHPPGSRGELPGLSVGAALLLAVSLWGPAAAPPRMALASTAPVPAQAQAKPGPEHEPTFQLPARPYAPQPDSARVAFQLGLAEERAGQLRAALRAYRFAVASDSSYPEASFRLGRLYSAMDRPLDAAAAFANEIRHHGGHVDARRELGLVLCRMGKTGEGLPFLEQLTQRFPDDDANWQALGFGYSLAGRLKDAETALRRAIANPPERASEHRDLGVVLVSLGRIEDARNEYRAAIALDDRDPSAWVNLGNLELRAKRPEQALEAYRAAEARDSSGAGALEGQFAALQALDRPLDAAHACTRWLHRRPDDDHARLEAARAWRAAGRPDLAYQVAADGVRRAPRSGDARVVLSIVLGADGKARESLTQLRAAERLYTDPLNRGKAKEMILATRAAAPESIRTLATQDSLAELERGR